jgi:F0F1-type ATP synthase alpha subunit
LKQSGRYCESDRISSVGYGEEVEFENKAKGLVLNLDEDAVYIVLLSEAEITRGMKVSTTAKFGNNVSES